MDSIKLVKKIAKHGNQNIIIIPSILKSTLKPNTIVQVTIDILEKPKEVKANG